MWEARETEFQISTYLLKQSSREKASLSIGRNLGVIGSDNISLMRECRIAILGAVGEETDTEIQKIKHRESACPRHHSLASTCVWHCVVFRERGRAEKPLDKNAYSNRYAT